MALDEIQAAIMRDFVGSGGAPISMPTISGRSDDELLAAIEGLQRRHYVRVVGPPNQNSLIGQDVDELHLRPVGADYIRTLRR